MAKGGSAKTLCYRKNWQNPLSGEAGSPHPAREARRQIFRAFLGKNLGFFPKFWEFFGIFGEFSLDLTGFSLI